MSNLRRDLTVLIKMKNLLRKTKKNEMNWNAIRGMRNHVAHGYDIMDSKNNILLLQKKIYQY